MTQMMKMRMKMKTEKKGCTPETVVSSTQSLVRTTAADTSTLFVTFIKGELDWRGILELRSDVCILPVKYEHTMD